jgi:hypothetical protein
LAALTLIILFSEKLIFLNKHFSSEFLIKKQCKGNFEILQNSWRIFHFSTKIKFVKDAWVKVALVLWNITQV